MKKITLIITALNEGNEPLETIKSVFENSNPELFDIILFNDGSKEWVDIPEKYNVKVIHNTFRKGAPTNFDRGVKLTETPYVCILNARMRFTKGWLEKGIRHLEKEPKTLFCTTSVIVKDGKLTDKKRYAANILEVSKESSILEPEWMKAKKSNCYEVPCVLGACYFITRKWYKHIEGFAYQKTYGGMCAYISLKSWAFGGKVKIIKNIEVGNIYRIVSGEYEHIKPYTDIVDDIVWNKVFTAFTLLDWNKACSLLHKIKYHDLFKDYYISIQSRLIKNMLGILTIRKRFKKKTILNINHLIK